MVYVCHDMKKFEYHYTRWMGCLLIKSAQYPISQLSIKKYEGKFHIPQCHFSIVAIFNQCAARIFILFIFLRFYLFIFREREREGERKGEKHQCVVASHVPPHWGPGLQPRHVPWLEIKLAIPGLAGWHSSHWATPTRAARIS